jgi:hypothetical protein
MFVRWVQRTLAISVLAPAIAMGGAAADALERSQAAAANLDMEQGLSWARRGLEAGDASPREVWSLYSLIAVTSAVMGYSDAASGAFGRTLQLFPGFVLPPGASPKLTRPYDAARLALRGRRLSALPESILLPDGRVRTVVRVDGDVHQMVYGGLLFTSQDGSFTPVRLAFTDAFFAQWRCETPPCAYYVTLVDAHGNTLLSAGTGESPLFVEAAAPIPGAAPAAFLPSSPPQRPTERAWYARPSPYLAAASAVAVAAGGVFAYRFQQEQTKLQALDRNRSEHRYQEAIAADQARRREHLSMLGAFGSATALGIVAVILW